jgi:hypothetical protein
MSLPEITKEQALAQFENNCAALARALKIKPQAVQQWIDGEPIPELQQWRLRANFPDKFPGVLLVSADPGQQQEVA